jgi:hypothetical protein
MEELLAMNQVEFEWALSYLISMWAYRNESPIKSIKIKDSKADNIFDNFGYESHMAEITLSA